jgi:photosystem II stability/assembly factor-like uncharacterized protein
MRAPVAVRWFVLLSLLSFIAAVPAALAQNVTAKQLQALRFRFVGPMRGNRASAVAGVPGDPNVYYVGAASGGVWKSTDGGFRWRPIFDKEPVQSIGALAVSPSRHSVVWVGTGESWVIRNAVTPGDGVYKSTDGGRTWHHMGLSDTGLISHIAINPYNSKNVFVCAMGTGTKENNSTGVWRTTDGGKTWKHVLFVNGYTGCSGLSMDAHDPNTLFAGFWQFKIRPWQMISGGESSGVYVSRDGGNTWKEIKGHGLPHPPVGKIDVAVAPTNPDRVYALIQTAQQGSLWRSDDGGRNWHVENYSRLLTERAGYFTSIAVSTRDENKVYVACNGFYVSGDGGRTFQQVPWGGDNHDIWIDPHNAKRIAFTGDEGVYISTNGGRGWHHVSLPIGQMYHVSTDNQIPYWVYANMQDDESERGPAYPFSTPNARTPYGQFFDKWQDDLGGCESGFIYPDPTNPDIIWSTCYGDEITRLDTKVGYPRAVSPWPDHPLDSPPNDIKYRCHWTPPMAIDPFDHNTVYYGCQVIFKTTDGGQSWKVISPDLSTNNPKYLLPSGGIYVNGKMRRQDNLGQFYGEVVYAIAPSPVQRGLIWAGTNDGQVWLTRDGGAHWANVTKNIPDLKPWGTISRIEPSHFDAGTAYIAVDRAPMGDTHPYIYMTTNYGQSWKLIVNGIPYSPESNVSSVAQDPYNKDLLFAGTNNALYVSFDDGGNWIPLQAGLPHAPVSWETVQKTFHDLVVSTYGRGDYLLEDITPLEQLTDQTMQAPIHVFKSRPSYRFFRDAHAWIDFSLPSDTKGKAEIEILDAHGNVVRHLTAFGHPGINRVYWDMRYAPPKLIKLRTTPASNPHVWDDLRFLGKTWRPITLGVVRRAEVGPIVAPGTYTVRVTVNGHTASQSLAVLDPPNTPGTPSQIQETVKMLLHIRDDISTVSGMVNQIEWLRKQLQTIEAMLRDEHNPAQANTLQAVENMDKKMQAVENKLLSPALANSDEKSYLAKYKLYLHLIWLNGEVGTGAGDVDGNPGYPPTDASVAVLHVLDGRLAAAQAEYRTLMQKELPQFNRTLASREITPLVAQMPAAESSTGAATGEQEDSNR